MVKRTVKKVQRIGKAVVTAFVTLFVLSGISSWLIWDQYYDGFFKQKIFQAVLLGNIVTSSVGALMVHMAGRR
jgi:tryptophan-rich sensory protein